MNLTASILLGGVEVCAAPYLSHGRFLLIGRRAYFPSLHEFFLAYNNVGWHVDANGCPTWDAATECRCMLGAES